MKKWLKITMVTLITLILSLMLIITIIGKVVDPNRFKPFIEKKVSMNTGKKLTIDGNLAWSLFPTFSLSTGAITLKNPAGFPDQALFSVSEMTFSVRVLPLLIGHITLGDVVVKDLKLDLIQKDNGEANWESPQQHPTAPSKETSTSSKSYFKLTSIPNVDITNFSFAFSDEHTGKNLKLTNAFLHIEKPGFFNAFPLTASFDIDGQNPNINAHVTLKSLLTLDLAGHRYEIDSLDMNANIKNSPMRITGISHVTLSLSTEGDDALELKRNLNGKGAMDVKEGMLHGIDIAYFWNLAEKLISSGAKDQTESESGLGDTAFDALSASFTIKQGLITNDDLLIKTSSFTTTGRGTVNLPGNAINYTLFVVKEQPATNPDGTPNTAKTKDAVPLITITGALDNPNIRLNKLDELTSMVTDTVKKIGNSVKENVGKVLEDLGI